MLPASQTHSPSKTDFAQPKYATSAHRPRAESHLGVIAISNCSSRAAQTAILRPDRMSRHSFRTTHIPPSNNEHLRCAEPFP